MNLCHSDSEDETPQKKLYTVKAKEKKRTERNNGEEGEEDLSLVPPHIMRIMQQVEEKKKIRKEKEEGKGSAKDSSSIMRNMMALMRSKASMEDAGAEERADRENDSAKISNARDIFRQREAMEQTGEEAKPVRAAKQKRVDVNVDFMTEGTHKAEELRQARLREMAAMRSARESNMDDEEMFNRKNKERSDDVKKQRELEIDMMRVARQEALEEEERMSAIQRREPQRAVSPGLVAARTGGVTRDFLEEGDRKVEQMRQEREREIREMKRARELELLQEEQEEGRDSRSEAARELEAFRASRGGGGGRIKDRYRAGEEGMEGRQGGFTKAPRSRGKSDNWIVNSSQDKAEMARLAREREIEMMMVARGQAIEEEEAERQEEEILRRADAERKGKEMAILVADLQRMRSETARNAEEEERMTRYQEEMLTRVMELHQIAKGGMIA